jgi:hypothetical protein
MEPAVVIVPAFVLVAMLAAVCAFATAISALGYAAVVGALLGWLVAWCAIQAVMALQDITKERKP